MGTIEIKDGIIKIVSKITKYLDSKTDINLSLIQILPLTYIISFAIGNKIILSSGYNTS